jgi:ABC-type phosphate transport system auxiliary subunit
VGTIISILWSLWRQNQNVETMKQGIIKSLKEALEKVPNAEQRRQIDVDVEKSFADLKDTVLTNINLKIASLQKSLDNAIAAVERRNVNIDNERKRLMAMQNAADKELAELKMFCVAS